jgi:hypothetical protein
MKMKMKTKKTPLPPTLHGILRDSVSGSLFAANIEVSLGLQFGARFVERPAARQRSFWRLGGCFEGQGGATLDIGFL